MANKTFKSFRGSQSHGMGAAGLTQARQELTIHDMTELQSYQFELGNEEKIYSISFNGRISSVETRKILEIMHSRTYADCPEAVWTYLEQDKLEYSHFKTELFPSIHWDIIARADILLRSLSEDAVDRQIGRADNYYAVMDYQKRLREDCHEGCCYAVKRIFDSGIYSYNIVGQTFTCDQYGSALNGYFAILSGDGRQHLQKLDESFEAVLPVFGCVDMLELLQNIDCIRTSRQAVKTAVK
ncbi:MAG: hypothetical protein K2N34_10540 [Lachnospiraceae bacterium]|nr:hypothetical protein [Lachnospiraceae bacterium]